MQVIWCLSQGLQDHTQEDAAAQLVAPSSLPIGNGRACQTTHRKSAAAFLANGHVTANSNPCPQT